MTMWFQFVFQDISESSSEKHERENFMIILEQLTLSSAELDNRYFFSLRVFYVSIWKRSSFNENISISDYAC